MKQARPGEVRLFILLEAESHTVVSMLDLPNGRSNHSDHDRS